MISGLNSSSVMGAIRTAGKARATMDTMSRQLATGQKVASVKDDGAAWARASAMSSEKVGWEQARTWADVRISVSDQRLALTDVIGEQLNKVMAGLVALTDPSLNAQSFSDLATEVGADYQSLFRAGIQSRQQAQQPIYASGTASDTATLQLPTGTVSYQDNPGQPQDYATSASGTVFALTYSGFGGSVTVRNSDGALLVGSGAQALSAITFLKGASDGWRAAVAGQAAGRAAFADWSARASANIDRLDTAIGSITDADLGKASTARAQADTRQQLALQTVQQAISAYGNYAGGLLGNVQRTQRGIIT